MKSTWRIPGLGGFVYSLDSSPLDPSRVALAVGDNTVRVWITNNSNDPFDSVLLWKGIQAKVSVVCFTIYYYYLYYFFFSLFADSL